MERFSPPSAEFWSLWQTHCHSAVHSQNAVCACVCARTLAQCRAVVAGADREPGSVFVGPVSGGSGSWIPSMTSQSVILAIEQLYVSPWQHFTQKH